MKRTHIYSTNIKNHLTSYQDLGGVNYYQLRKDFGKLPDTLREKANNDFQTIKVSEKTTKTENESVKKSKNRLIVTNRLKETILNVLKNILILQVLENVFEQIKSGK